MANGHRIQPTAKSLRSESDSVLTIPGIHQGSGTDPSLQQVSSEPSIPSVASPRYVQQCRAVMELQRKTYASEQALWGIERGELLKRITELEASVQRLQAITTSQNTLLRKQSESGPSSWSNKSTNGSRQSSESSALGEDIWKGAGADQVPTRSFPESSSSFKPGDRLPSISETQPHQDSRHVSVDPIAQSVHKPSLTDADVTNMDGINFKRSAITQARSRDVFSSGSNSPSPAQTPPIIPDNLTKPLAQSRVPVIQKLNVDPFTKDAGHTPLARHHFPLAIDGTSEASTSRSTPSKHPDPIDAEPAPPRQPSERRDSYFPIASTDEQASGQAPPDCDEDPALKGPLGLTNEREGDEQFLSQLDDKLLSAATADVHRAANNNGEDNDGEGKDGREEGKKASGHRRGGSDEPTLRLKKSMNFGAQLGEL